MRRVAYFAVESFEFLFDHLALAIRAFGEDVDDGRLVGAEALHRLANGGGVGFHF